MLYGAGRGFSAGLDMGSFAAIAAGGREGPLADLPARTHGIANLPQQAALVWREVPVPVIAAVHGVAFGGGFQIALGADVRYVAPDAKLSILEIEWGLVPDMGGIARMRELARGDVIRDSPSPAGASRARRRPAGASPPPSTPTRSPRRGECARNRRKRAPTR